MKKYLFIILAFFPFFLLAQENNSLSCGDGLDNDGDGLIDCADPDCQGLPNAGCSTCFENGSSFADFIVEYLPTCPGDTENRDPIEALGVADNDAVTLGDGGNIKLGFSNNIVINSGDSDPDIWVFEAGADVEASTIALKPFDSSTNSILTANGIVDSNGDGYYEVGTISGSTSFIDLDAIIPGLSSEALKFDAISITDVPAGSCSGNFPGADIDAVCALSSILTEICNNGIDDDNNGEIDEGCAFAGCDFNNELDQFSTIEGNVCVYGAIQIGDVIKLTPRNAPPTNPTMGTLYFDETLLKLRVWNGSSWRDCSQ